MRKMYNTHKARDINRINFSLGEQNFKIVIQAMLMTVTTGNETRGRRFISGLVSLAYNTDVMLEQSFI